MIDATVAPTGRHARAVVQLGRLAPADVEVHAAPRSSASAARDASAAPRLWSSQSYANGSFVFEGDLDEGAGAGGDELLVSVVPSFRWTVSRRAARPCYGPAKRSAVAPSP